MTSKVKVNTVETESGSTLTLGKSGDTVTLASGASQSGFGRTGTVDWDTTAKTASFTATSGDGYFVNTTSGALTVTLPASPSAGDIVSVSDYALTFDTNNCTIARNSSNIDGSAADLILSTEGIAVTLVYVDATKGWKPVNSNEVVGGPKFVAASGGTVTTCGDFKIHTFTGPGCFVVSCEGNPAGSSSVDYLVVAGGGGGGGDAGGGGGAGGFRLSNSTCMPGPQTSPLANSTGLPVSATSYPITIGGGGAGHSAPAVPPAQKGQNGSNSVFSTITSAGGGGGGQSANPPTPTTGQAGSGGSGGGGRGAAPTGGAGNTPPVSPPQGNPGGNGPAGGGGGGGASAAGGSAGPSSPSPGGNGGAGSFVVSSGFAGCNGTTGPVCGARYFAGGGGGSADQPGPAAGTGGTGGGGPGQQRPSSSPGVNGTTNTGGGGGGGAVPSSGSNGGTGGSGIVIIRYKFQ